MKNNAVTNIWKDFLLLLEEQKIVDKTDTEDVMAMFIEDKIDPTKMAANIQALIQWDMRFSGYNDEEQIKYKPTESLTSLISYIDRPMWSPLWFMAAYPDVIARFNTQRREYMQTHWNNHDGRLVKMWELFDTDSVDNNDDEDHVSPKLYRNLVKYYKKTNSGKLEVAVEEWSENDFYLGYAVLNASWYNNIIEMIAEFTTKYYLELSTRYKDEFKEESCLLATAGILDALPYVHDTKTISPLEIRDMARDVVKNNAKKTSPKDSLVDFIIKLATKILEIDTPDMDVLEIENACTEQKELIKKTVQKVKKNYTSEEVFASRTDVFMRDMNFRLYREILWVKDIDKEDSEEKFEPNLKKDEGIKQKKKWKFFKEMRLVLRFTGVLSIIWGIITLDRFRIIFGIILILWCFLFYYIKQRKYLRDNLVYTWYKIISDIKNSTGIHVIEESNQWTIFLLFYVWLIIHAISYLHMSEEQALKLANSIFHDLDVTNKKNDQLLMTMMNAMEDEQNMKVIQFWIVTFNSFITSWKEGLSDTKKHLMNDFGTVDFKL